MLPPICLSLCSGVPGLVLDEEVMAGLPLPAAAPPALVSRDLFTFGGQAGPGRGVSRKELAVSPGYVAPFVPF